jgi:hypothetical protein
VSGYLGRCRGWSRWWPYGVHIRTVHKLNGALLRLHALQLKRVHAGQMIRAVGEQLGCRPLISGVNRGEQAGVDAAHPGAGIPEGVERSYISPLRKQGPITRGHVFDELRHLHGQVELVGDLGEAFLQLTELLLAMLFRNVRCLVMARSQTVDFIEITALVSLRLR